MRGCKRWREDRTGLDIRTGLPRDGRQIYTPNDAHRLISYVSRRVINVVSATERESSRSRKERKAPKKLGNQLTFRHCCGPFLINRDLRSLLLRLGTRRDRAVWELDNAGTPKVVRTRHAHRPSHSARVIGSFVWTLREIKTKGIHQGTTHLQHSRVARLLERAFLHRHSAPRHTNHETVLQTLRSTSPRPVCTLPVLYPAPVPVTLAAEWAWG